MCIGSCFNLAQFTLVILNKLKVLFNILRGVILLIECVNDTHLTDIQEE